MKNINEIEKALLDANDICRSAHSIAQRKGTQTNWDAFLQKVERSLKMQHKVMLENNLFKTER